MEELNAAGRTDLVYSKVAELTWKKKKEKGKKACVADSAGNILSEPEEVREAWRIYIESLYDKDGKPREEELKIEKQEEVEEDEKGPAILKSEFQAALLEMKEEKAVGVDDIPTEMLKSLGEKALQELYEIYQQMYERGKWQMTLQDWL